MSYKEQIKRNLDLVIGGLIIVILFIALSILLPMLLDTSTPLAYISSSSMEPTYYKGDLVIIKGVSGEDIDVGDVIVFQPIGYNELILHRVAAKKKNGDHYYFLTKGDNPETNKYIDSWGWVPDDRVKGKVVARFPLVGYIFMFLATPIGKIVLISVIIILLLLDFSDSSKEAVGRNSKSRFNFRGKKLVAVGLVVIVIPTATFVLLTNYVYLGEGQADVELEYIGQPLDAFEFKIYPIFLKINSYGLNKGYVKKVIVTPISIINSTNGPPAVWTIIYPFIGSKEICLNVLIQSNSTLENYYIHIVFYVEYFGGETKVFEKTHVGS